MALISKIRNNSWLLVILIGLALAAFIIMDMTSGGGGAAGQQFELGEVNGEPIDWQEFQQMEQALYVNSSGNLYERRDYLWNFFVTKAIIEEEADALGLAVSEEELEELQFGTRLSPVIQQRFMNPQTGQLDRQTLNQYRTAINQNQLPPEQIRFWDMQKKEIVANRLQTKLTNLVGKSFYTPTWMAEQQGEWQRQQLTVAYVKVPFSEISDAQAQPTEDEYRSFLEDNKTKYSNEEETRVAEYTVINVRPTPTDSANLWKDMTERAANFVTAENDSIFVEFNNGYIVPTYQLPSELDPAISDTVLDISVDSVYGPYESGGKYSAFKVLGKMILPDSVKARHIFRQIDAQNPNSYPQQKALLDSLQVLVETGRASFDSLAMVNGQDGSAQKGGDLGYYARGRMLPSFESETFYEMEVGELRVFASQAGLHLVEVLDKVYNEKEEGVRLAMIQENIVPSDETQDNLFTQAGNLAADYRTLEELRDKVIGIANLSMTTTNALAQNDFTIDNISSKEAAREIVRYLFEEDTYVGDVSPDVFVVEEPELYYNKQYIVAGLHSIIPEGKPNLEDVKAIIHPEVMKEKKGSMIASKIKGQSLSSVAQMFALRIDTAQGVNLNSTFARGMGNEPKVIASLQGVAEGESKGPIVGDNGVYLVQVISTVDMPVMSNIAQIRQQNNQKYRSQVFSGLMESLKKNASIEDGRFTFY